MKRLMTSSSSVLLAAAVPLGAAFALIMAPAATAAPAKKPMVRIQAKAFTKKVARVNDTTITIPTNQRLSVSCRPNERAIAQGILSSTHYLTAQSFGPAAGSSFVVGPPGVARVRMQVLCAQNITVRHLRKAARHIPGGGYQGKGTARGALTCPAGFAPSGMQSILDYAPGFGAFSSIPTGPRGWKIEAFGVPDAILTAGPWANAAFVDMACIKASSVTKVKTVGRIGANGVAAFRATCPGARRVLGWGMNLSTYTQYASNGRWATPYVAKAQFLPNLKTMAFEFRIPSGVDLTYTTGSATEVHLVCGVPRR